MSNYDGIDRLSPGDEDLLEQDARSIARRWAEGVDLALGCWGCTGSQRCIHDHACKGTPGYQCGFVGCDHVAVQGGLCVKHERRVAW